MKYFFPPKNQKYTYLQTNRSDDIGSIWSSFNLDFQTNLGMMRLAQKLVINTSAADDASLGTPSAFELCFIVWWAICDTTIFKTTSADAKQAFTKDLTGVQVGGATSQFDITNPGGTTFRYTWDGGGTDPGITALTFPVGSTVVINVGNFSAGNRGTFLVTGSGANYFEVTNASGVVESNKTLGAGSLAIAGGTASAGYSIHYSDLAVFDNRLWATSKDTLYSKSSELEPWILRDSLTANKLHKLVYFKQFDRLYYSNTEETISSIDAANAVADAGANYAIDLTVSVGQITSLAATSSFIWIGNLKPDNSSDTGGTYGSVLAWDGFSAQVTAEYLLPSAGPIAMTVLNDVTYVLDTEGRVLKFTGYSFEEISRLPINRILLTGASTSSGGLAAGRFCHFNGMQGTKNNTIQILIRNTNNDNGNTINEELPSGIWELDLATNNFTHRYSATLKTLASSTVTDYGQNKIVTPGALRINTMGYNRVGIDPGRSTILAGFKVFTDASASQAAIYIDSPAHPTTDTEGQKRGYFVTTWFNTQEIQDKFTRLWAVFTRFLDATDKIIFKYRTNDVSPVYGDITWVSTTVFTTAVDVTAYGPTAAGFNGTTGGEVEIVQGKGSGSCTHISSITGPGGGLYTVTLDTAVPNVAGTARARFQKWIKLYPPVTGQVISYAQLPINKSDTRIEIKGVMEFTGDDEFQKLGIFSNEDIKINA